VVTLAARTAPEHANCRSCHDEHAVQTAAQSCERCHADVRSTHPPEQGLGMCLGCHPPHPEPGAKRLKEVTRVGCFRCHDDAPTETAHHGAKTTCADCHTPHQFALTAAAKNPDFCLGCHGGGVGARRPGERVRPAKGHDNCAACHTTAAHRPEAPRPACGSCHAPQEQTITKGHETCTECHPAHEARVPANVTCERCHQTQLRARHGQVDGGCETCHRPHGPEGVVKPPACASCHDTGRLFGLHRLADHATCNDCHASHDQGATGQRAACTTACHQTMTTHEPQATTCVGCHLFDQPRGAK
jgi:predicted CXXCH cytochrome family protein